MSDADGYFSASLFYVYCKLINPDCNIEPLFHHRNPKAHGLNDDEVMEYLKQQTPNYLFINDAGTNDTEYFKELYDLGWKICCSDHHQKSIDNPYCVLVNNQISEKVENKGLSGTGVVWKCCKRYDELFGSNYAKELLSYVMCSIISDNMSLLYEENYSFIKWGKKNIHKNLIPFIKEFNNGNTNKDYSFGFIVKSNATIRLGELQDKKDFFYGLCGEFDNVNDLLLRMKKFHNEQTLITKQLMNSSVECIHDGKIGLFRICEKSPLTGLVANKLMGQKNKPILLVHKNSNGECSGSCRSPIEIKDELNKSGLFIFNEGHLASFGTSYNIDNELKIIEYLDNMEVPEPCKEVLISAETKCLPRYLFEFNECYRCYFGTDIPVPNVYIPNIKINSDNIKVIGKNKTTVSFQIGDVNFIKFFCTNEFKESLFIGQEKNLNIEIIGELHINEFRGYQNKQVVIKEIEINY